ncbi:MAG: alpha/beta hydrolase [Lachnospirales bacterium]
MATFYRKNKRKRKIRVVIIVICSIFVLLIVLLGFISANFYKTAMISDREIATYEDKSQYSKYTVFKEDVDLEERMINSNDKNIEKWTTLNNSGLVLVGYAHKQTIESNGWVIVVHGYDKSSIDMNDYSNIFFEKGYNVLTVDNEYHGESEGTHITMGMEDSLNIVEWAWKVVNEDPEAKIMLFGLSMGASTVMMASDPELSLPANVKAVIEDCGYTSMKDIFTYQLNYDYGFPSFPIIPAVNLYNKIVNGYFFNDRSPIEAVSNTSLPMLFIHGSEDDYVPFYMGEELYNAHTGEKDYLVVESAGHADSLEVGGTLYKNKIYDFLSKYMN